MPRSTREWSRRKLEEACNNIDWAGTHVHQVMTVYEQEHPEIAAPLQTVLEGLANIQELIQKVRKSY